MTGNDADAADATQEALIAIVRGLPRFDGRSRFSTWAYRVATNACLDELRRRKRRPVLAGNDDELTEDVSSAAPAELDVGVAARLDVDRAIRLLPLDFRAPVVLRDLTGLDYAEIAEVLDVPVGTVKSRIARGRAQLAALLGDSPDPPAGNLPAGTDRPTP